MQSANGTADGLISGFLCFRSSKAFGGILLVFLIDIHLRNLRPYFGNKSAQELIGDKLIVEVKVPLVCLIKSDWGFPSR